MNGVVYLDGHDVIVLKVICCKHDAENTAPEDIHWFISWRKVAVLDPSHAL